jgi:hypothetical protein
VHYCVPNLTRGATSDAKGAVAQVEPGPAFDVFGSVWRSLMRKAERDVVEESSAATDDRLHRSTYDSNHVEIESGYKSVLFLTMSGSRRATPKVECVCMLQHANGLRAADGRDTGLTRLVGWIRSIESACRLGNIYALPCRESLRVSVVLVNNAAAFLG